MAHGFQHLKHISFLSLSLFKVCVYINSSTFSQTSLKENLILLAYILSFWETLTQNIKDLLPLSVNYIPISFAFNLPTQLIY